MTNKDFNNYILSPILIGVLVMIFYFLFGEMRELIKFNQTDKNTLRKINTIKIEMAATDSMAIPIKKEYNLVIQNIIESDKKINTLMSEISELKEQILEATKNGEDVSEQINLLNQKETELNTYLTEISKQTQVVKDTIQTYPEKLRTYTAEFERAKTTSDSLSNVLKELIKKCN